MRYLDFWMDNGNFQLEILNTTNRSNHYHIFDKIKHISWLGTFYTVISNNISKKVMQKDL